MKQKHGREKKLKNFWPTQGRSAIFDRLASVGDITKSPSVVNGALHPSRAAVNGPRDMKPKAENKTKRETTNPPKPEDRARLLLLLRQKAAGSNANRRREEIS